MLQCIFLSTSEPKIVRSFGEVIVYLCILLGYAKLILVTTCERNCDHIVGFFEGSDFELMRWGMHLQSRLGYFVRDRDLREGISRSPIMHLDKRLA